MAPFRILVDVRQRRRIDATVALVGLFAGILLGWPLACAPHGVSAGSSSERAAIRRVEQTARSVAVLLVGDGCLGRTSGTGVRVDARRVLTASHVVAGESSVQVRDSEGRRATGSEIKRLGAVDAAVVSTASTGMVASLRIGRPAVGERLVVAGAPNGGSLRTRVARAVGELDGRAPSDPRTAIVLDVQARPGESGGPVLDLAGRLVGIVYARANADGRALVIPLDAIDLSSSGTPGVAC